MRCFFPPQKKYEKNMHVIRVFFFGDLCQIPLSPIGDLKNPSGIADPRGFSNPLWASGDLGEDPLEKTRITYINHGW